MGLGFRVLGANRLVAAFELLSVQVGDLEFGAVALNLAPYSNKRQMTEEHVFNHSKSLVRVVENPHEMLMPCSDWSAVPCSVMSGRPDFA